MKILNFKGVFFALILFLSPIFANKIVLINQNILSDKVESKIATIGEELREKTGIYVGLGIFENLGGKSINEKFKELNLKPPYAFLMLAKSEHKLEIFADEDTLKLFDKEQILSPYPARGSILPILTSKNGKDIYNASMLNGYADIAEQIAKSKGVKLENAIGSSNKITLDILRFAVYGSVILVIGVIVFAKFRRRNAK